MNIREMIEGIIMVACGTYIMSPIFNRYHEIEALQFLESLPEATAVHLAWGLVPIILYFIVMMFIEGAGKK